MKLHNIKSVAIPVTPTTDYSKTAIIDIPADVLEGLIQHMLGGEVLKFENIVKVSKEYIPQKYKNYTLDDKDFFCKTIDNDKLFFFLRVNVNKNTRVVEGETKVDLTISVTFSLIDSFLAKTRSYRIDEILNASYLHDGFLDIMHKKIAFIIIKHVCRTWKDQKVHNNFKDLLKAFLTFNDIVGDGDVKSLDQTKMFFEFSNPKNRISVRFHARPTGTTELHLFIDTIEVVNSKYTDRLPFMITELRELINYFEKHPNAPKLMFFRRIDNIKAVTKIASRPLNTASRIYSSVFVIPVYTKTQEATITLLEGGNLLHKTDDIDYA